MFLFFVFRLHLLRAIRLDTLFFFTFTLGRFCLLVVLWNLSNLLVLDDSVVPVDVLFE